MSNFSEHNSRDDPTTAATSSNVNAPGEATASNVAALGGATASNVASLGGATASNVPSGPTHRARVRSRTARTRRYRTQKDDVMDSISRSEASHKVIEEQRLAMLQASNEANLTAQQETTSAIRDLVEEQRHMNATLEKLLAVITSKLSEK